MRPPPEVRARRRREEREEADYAYRAPYSQAGHVWCGPLPLDLSEPLDRCPLDGVRWCRCSGWSQ
jgi:hypothetical protein